MQLRNALDGIEIVHGYKVNPKMCCEKCVFHSGEHSEWCAHRAAPPPPAQAFNNLRP